MRRFAVLLAVLCLPAAIAATSASAAECPNEALRAGPSAALPGCRAYEMVSPIDKSGGNVSSTISVVAAPGGNAASFGSTASFADSPASPLGSTYIARRGSSWASEAVDPEQFNHSGLLIRGTPASSPDLRFSFGVSRLALTPGAIEGGSNLYLRDNATGTRSLLAAASGELLFTQASGAGGGVFLGASADWSHVLISTREALTVTPSSPAPAAGMENVYDLTGGVAHLVNVLPDGTVDPLGAHLGTAVPYQHLISEDGSRTFFQVGGFGSGPLYLRENGTTTKPISISQNGAEAGEVKPAELGLATPDGSFAYFTSSYELIEGAGQNALYRYDVASGETTPMIPEPPAGGPQIRYVLGASRDGSYVYFSSSAVLAEGATEAVGGVNFYVWHEGSIKLIGQTDSVDTEYSFPRQWSVSPNGKEFGFASSSPMTAEDVSSPACPTSPFLNNAPEHCVDVYSYDVDSGRLTCVSCKGEVNPVSGEWEWLPGRGFSELGGQYTHENGTGDEYPHAVLDNGTVFFETPNSLLPRDSNGVGDVYAWREGFDQLISTGTSEEPSTFGDSTPDGSDVYFLTKQQLVKQDSDESTDVYDDRELGGLTSQWPPGSVAPCDGEGCRGTSPAPPTGLPEGSTVSNSPTVAARSCGALQAKAGKASRHARQLSKRARRGAKRGGASAQSRRLRRKAAAARKRAHGIHQKAVTCGRNG